MARGYPCDCPTSVVSAEAGPGDGQGEPGVTGAWVITILSLPAQAWVAENVILAWAFFLRGRSYHGGECPARGVGKAEFMPGQPAVVAGSLSAIQKAPILVSDTSERSRRANGAT